MLELRWDLGEPSKTGLTLDPGFRIFMGRYYDRVRNQYPHVEDLPASDLPERLAPYVVRHQFWKSKGHWPVTQIGPGILTVNETDGYLWDTFRPLLVDVFKALFASYPTELAKLQLNQIVLRYIDAVRFDPEKAGSPILQFLRESLHTNIQVDPLLFSEPNDSESPLGLNLSLTYRLLKPKGVVVLTLGNGLRGDIPSIIWETKVVSNGPEVPTTLADFERWLDDAHSVSDNWFFALIRGHLLDSFEDHSNAEHHSDRDVKLPA